MFIITDKFFQNRVFLSFVCLLRSYPKRDKVIVRMRLQAHKRSYLSTRCAPVTIVCTFYPRLRQQLFLIHISFHTFLTCLIHFQEFSSIFKHFKALSSDSTLFYTAGEHKNPRGSREVNVRTQTIRVTANPNRNNTLK